jgi:hypothetical protein
MKKFLDKIRTPKKTISIRTQIVITLAIMVGGFLLGVFQKWLDESGSSVMPSFFEKLDINNYFGRLAVWILMATIISVYSYKAIRASINTFLFLICMLAGYYLYCNFVCGFFPKSYMMMWVVVAMVAFFLAFICWYAKGKGFVAILISSVILGVLFSMAFNITTGFYIKNNMEVVTWIIGVVILLRKPKELAFEMGISLVVAFLYQTFMPF